MRKLIIVDGLPVIKQLEKFDKNRNFVEVALIF